MRGEAYLDAKRGSEAAAEFQKILNNRCRCPCARGQALRQMDVQTD
jgi:hypothetical protein